MKVRQFDILMDDAEVNPQAVYRAGQTISFRVHLILDQPVKCRSVWVEFKGGSRVHWTETRNKHTKHYRSTETYLDQRVTIFSPPASGESAEYHAAGEWLYPVAFQLPHECPSSFEGGVGYVRYSIQANIDRPWKFDNCTVKYFTVIRDLDLNLQPMDLVGPFSSDDSYSVDCCYCFSCCCGNVSVSVRLGKRAFVPGEHIHVTGEIRNTSKTDINSISLELYQRNQFHARSKTKTRTRVASTLSLEGGLAQGRSVQLNHLLPVEPVPCSFLQGCNNIELNYYFRVNADGGCCLAMQKECCELLIGTVPLSYNSQAGQPPFTQQPFTVMGQQPFTALDQQPIPSAPPPSYAECTFGRVEMDKVEGRDFSQQSAWAPSYPVYAMQQQQQQQQPLQLQYGATYN